jgi:hypothetical protein
VDLCEPRRLAGAVPGHPVIGSAPALPATGAGWYLSWIMSRLLWFFLSAAALAISAVGAHGAWEQNRKITTWKPVEVTVVARRLDERVSHGKGGRRVTYQPKVTFKYQVNGRPFSSSNVLPYLDHRSFSWAFQIINRFREGRTYEGYYDPQNPSEAFLLREYSFEPYWMILIPAGCLGMAVFLVNLLSRRPPAPPLTRSDGWFDVLPARSTERKLTLAILVAVPWHLLALLAAGHYVAAARPPYETAAYWITAGYEALGMVPISAALYYLLLRWNVANGQVVVDREFPAAGEEIAVRIEQEVRGNLEVESLRVGLLCEETTKRKTGSKTSISTQLRHQEWQTPLADRPGYPGETLKAELRFQVPEDAMSSTPRGFKGYPRYRWRIALQTKLRGSPDYRADFPITVGPRPGDPAAAGAA